MCRWMGSQERNILYLLSHKFWWLCTRKLANINALVLFHSLFSSVVKNLTQRWSWLYFFRSGQTISTLSIHDSLFQALFWSMVGSGQKISWTRAKNWREKKIEPQSPLVFSPRVPICVRRVRFNSLPTIWTPGTGYIPDWSVQLHTSFSESLSFPVVTRLQCWCKQERTFHRALPLPVASSALFCRFEKKIRKICVSSAPHPSPPPAWAHCKPFV